MNEHNCLNCKHSYIKDFAYLVCSLLGIRDLEDVKRECKYWEKKQNERQI